MVTLQYTSEELKMMDQITLRDRIQANAKTESYLVTITIEEELA
jgi:hypothetical protein